VGDVDLTEQKILIYQADKIEDCIDYLHQKRLQPVSINLYLVIIAAFYNFLN